MFLFVVFTRLSVTFGSAPLPSTRLRRIQVSHKGDPATSSTRGKNPRYLT